MMKRLLCKLDNREATLSGGKREKRPLNGVIPTSWGSAKPLLVPFLRSPFLKYRRCFYYLGMARLTDPETTAIGETVFYTHSSQKKGHTNAKEEWGSTGKH